MRTIGIAADRQHFATRTRACERVLIADTGGVELIDSLRKLAEAGDSGVILPCTDAAVLRLARDRAALGVGHALSLPSLETVLTLLDKIAFAEYAQDADLPIPRTLSIPERTLAAEAGAELGFPCVLKPAVKSDAWQHHERYKAYKLDSSSELLATYDRVARWGDRLIVQEWIPGEDRELFGCSAYLDRESRPLATFVSRKERQWPLGVGNCTLGVECRNDEVLNVALRLFEGAQFHGLANLEMKRHATTGQYLIVEPNVGRPVSRSPIAEQGGVEMLYTAYCDAAGLPLPESRTQHYGRAKWTFVRYDVRAALAERRRGRLSAREWLRSLRGCRWDATISVSDPLPALADFRGGFARLSGSAARRIAGRSRSLSG